jgi:putative hydrolase of HD superfamily
MKKYMKKTSKNNLRKITNLFFEFGQLRRVPHVGFTMAGVEKPDSVAEHTARVAQIGYVLSKMENADTGKVVLMCLFHDLGEARVNDSHRVETRYHNYFALKKAEMKAFKEQVSLLPEKMEKELSGLMDEFEQRKTIEAKCVKDADYLEQAVSAKEYLDIGYKGCEDWIKNIKKALKTKTAKEFLKIIKTTNRNDWWKYLKRFEEVLSK